MKKKLFFKQIIPVLVCLFLLQQIIPGYAQTNLVAPVAGGLISLSQPFSPMVIKGLALHPENPLRFDFIIDSGDDAVANAALKAGSTRLIKYFLASLTVPENEQWVNLSPYEKNRIIPASLGHTEMGKDLLAEDYLLKQLSSSLTHPDKKLGKDFWDKIYAAVYKKSGKTHVPVNAFNKIWIVPEKAVVYEHGNNVFIIENHLKVMLEDDYLVLRRHQQEMNPANTSAETIGESAKIFRELFIPEIEKEVNEGKHFAQLRQVYNSMLLATWFKRNLKQTLLGRIYADQNKVGGIETPDKKFPEEIYNQYLETFKKGVFNFIKEE